MNFFKIRRARKDLKNILHYAKHVRHMREDVADPQLLQELRETEQTARTVRKGRDRAEMEKSGEAVVKRCEKIAPPRCHRKIRENVEVFFVAIAAAMAIRAYFFQPFKIPTGSMQPTLYGITIRPEPTIQSRHPLAVFANRILFGERYQSVLARADGRIRTVTGADGVSRLYGQINSDESSTIYIGDVPHKIPNQLIPFCRFGEELKAGDPIVEGVVKSGDYILVNRVWYNFVRPERGDVAVFDTRELTHPQVRTNAYYIKRIVGLPQETVIIDSGKLLINGTPPDDPRFDKIFNDERYSGYQIPHRINPAPLYTASDDAVRLGDEEYLFFGDNTENSLDGRYFGAIHRRRIMGPAFLVCWPLDRLGPVERIR